VKINGRSFRKTVSLPTENLEVSCFVFFEICWLFFFIFVFYFSLLASTPTLLLMQRCWIYLKSIFPTLIITITI
jgi:hypothetical protein